MFALRFTNGGTTYRLAPAAFDRHGETWASRLLSVSGEAGTVDQWLPGSIRASRVDAVLDDADGALFEAFLQTDPRGKSLELVWIGESRTTTRLVTTISFWQRDSSGIKLVGSDPRLLLLQAPPTPYVRDIDRDAEGADNLLPQVYGHATGLPIGGLSVGETELTLYVANDEVAIDALYYNGELIPAADWTREVTAQPFSHTRITIGGDRTRTPRNFSWDGGNGSLGPGCAVYLALLNNGVSLEELDTNAFLALDATVLARGLSVSENERNAAVVLTDSTDTLERVITQALETWGVAVYVGEDGRFRPLFPFGDVPALPDLPEIPPLFYSAWASETPRAATHWIAENDYHWQENRWGRLETIRNADNLASYGREIEGAKLNLWYSRDLIGINFAIDRTILETHSYLRTLAVVDPSEEIVVGDYVKTPEEIALPVQSFVVDGMSFEQSGVEERSHRLSLTRALGTGMTALVTASGTEMLGSAMVEIGQRLDVDLATLFTGGDGGLRFALVEAPSWMSIDDDGHLVGDAELPGTDDITYAVRLRAIDRSGQVAVGTYSVDVGYVLFAPSGTTTASVVASTDETATIEWEGVPRAETYTVVVDGVSVPGIMGRQYQITGITRPQNTIVTVQAVNSVGDGPVGPERTLHFLGAPMAPTVNFTQPTNILENGYPDIIPGNFPNAAFWQANNINLLTDFCTNPLGSPPQVDYTIPLVAVAGVTSYVVQESQLNDFAGAPTQVGNFPEFASSFMMPNDHRSSITRYFRYATVGSGGQSPWSPVMSITADYPQLDLTNMRRYRQGPFEEEDEDGEIFDVYSLTFDIPIASILTGTTLRVQTAGVFGTSGYGITRLGTTYIRIQGSDHLYDNRGNPIRRIGPINASLGVGGGTCLGEIQGPSRRLIPGGQNVRPPADY